MVKQFVHKHWPLGGRTIRFKGAAAVPNLIEAFDADFQREYPQLAVAVGGALPVLDQRLTMKDYAGAANQHPQLERFPVTGAVQQRSRPLFQCQVCDIIGKQNHVCEL